MNLSLGFPGSEDVGPLEPVRKRSEGLDGAIARFETMHGEGHPSIRAIHRQAPSDGVFAEIPIQFPNP